MNWTVPKLLRGEVAFIIGGGPSLKGMDLSPIHDRAVIGCNDAYRLGSWVDICYFGDWGWYYGVPPKPPHRLEHFHGHKEALRSFGGLKITSSNRRNDDHLNIIQITRIPIGIHLDGSKIGWYNNTGASAVCLAAMMGAVGAVLLGFDMQNNGKGETNWHENLKDAPSEKSYRRFKQSFEVLKRDLDKELPAFSVINATPGSALPTFPVTSLEEYLEKEEAEAKAVEEAIAAQPPTPRRAKRLRKIRHSTRNMRRARELATP